MGNFNEFMKNFADAVRHSNANVVCVKGITEEAVNEPILSLCDKSESVFASVGYCGRLGHGDLIAYKDKYGGILAVRVMDPTQSFMMVISMFHKIYGMDILTVKQISSSEVIFYID